MGLLLDTVRVVGLDGSFLFVSAPGQRSPVPVLIRIKSNPPEDATVLLIRGGT